MPPAPPPGSPPPRAEASAELLARVPKLLDAMRSVGSGLELHSTLRRICETAADLAHARYAAIGVVDEDGDGLADFVHHGLDEATVRRVGHLPDGRKGLLGALIRDPEPVRLTDLTRDPRSCGFPEHHPPMRGFLGVPIRVQGEIFGNLYVTDKHAGEPFDDHDLAMVRVLATEAGIAIGNARLYEAAQQRERWIDGSVAVTTALLSGGDTDDALQTVAEQARRLSGAAAGIVLLPADGGGLEIVAVDAPQPTNALGAVIPPENGIVAELLAGRPVFVDDAATDPRLNAGPARSYGPVMLVPLCRDGKVLGSLVMPRARGAPVHPDGARARRPVRLAGRAGAHDGRGPARPGTARRVRGPGPDRPGPARPRHPAAVRDGDDAGERPARVGRARGARRGRWSRRRTRRHHPGDPLGDLRAPAAGRGAHGTAHPRTARDHHGRRPAGLHPRTVSSARSTPPSAT